MNPFYQYLGWAQKNHQIMKHNLNFKPPGILTDGKANSGRWINPLKMSTLILTLLCISLLAYSQETKSENLRMTGSATVTTKGLSTFPNLTLGKPAVIFDFSVGGDQFRFDPTLRFGLDGKPWTFIFWLRHEAIRTEKFGLRIGAHPAVTFKTIDVVQNGSASEMLRATTYLAAEIAPVFRVAKNISLSPYYLFSYGIEDYAVQYSNFFTLIANITNINLSENIYSNLLAQVFYLKMDDWDGVFINSTLSVNKRNFPLSVSSTLNRAIESTIPGDKLLWNLNLIYRFGGDYRKDMP